MVVVVVCTKENFADSGYSNSDGIARVHGMANVQAEELVEYVNDHFIIEDGGMGN